MRINMPERITSFGQTQTARVGGGANIGWFVRFDSHGQPQVDFEGNNNGPLCARVALSGCEILDHGMLLASVVLVFEHDDATKPIIIGVCHSSPSVLPHRSSIDCASCRIEVEGGKVNIFARDELHLQCGEGSLTIRKDGKVLLRGTNITSRA